MFFPPPQLQSSEGLSQKSPPFTSSLQAAYGPMSRLAAVTATGRGFTVACGVKAAYSGEETLRQNTAYFFCTLRRDSLLSLSAPTRYFYRVFRKPSSNPFRVRSPMLCSTAICFFVSRSGRFVFILFGTFVRSDVLSAFADFFFHADPIPRWDAHRVRGGTPIFFSVPYRS